MLGSGVAFQPINTFLTEDMTCFATTHHNQTQQLHVFRTARITLSS